MLEGGYEAWANAGLPLVAKSELDRLAPKRPSLWVTRRRPKIDRIACPWLIRRFLDPQARILFVDPDQVVNVARESGGVPFDIKDVELSHDGERCSFDTMLKLFGLESEPSLARLALIVRGADTARPDLAPEAAGLHAVSLGLSALAGDDDHGLLERGFMVYDALFAWLRFAARSGTTGRPKPRDDARQPVKRLPRPSFGEAFKVWLKIGCINFGGPAGQIALMHRILVDEKKWVDEPRFLHALNFCMLLPGPEAQKLATYLGWLLHGVRGGLTPASCSCCRARS